MAAVPNGQLVDVTFERNVVMNAYDFIGLTPTVRGARDWRINDKRIYAVRRAFDFSGLSRESTQILGNMFTDGIYGSVAQSAKGYLAQWSALNAESVRADTGTGDSAFIDGMTATASLTHCYRYGERVVSSVLNMFQGANNCYDGIGTLLSVEGSSGYVGSQYGGFHVLGVFDLLAGRQKALVPAANITLNQNGQGRASFTDIAFGYAGGDVIDVVGTGPTVLSVRGGVLESYGHYGKSDAWGVKYSNPSADLTISTTFMASGSAKNGVLLTGCGAAILTANISDGLEMPVFANCCGQAVVTGNLSRDAVKVDGLRRHASRFQNLATYGNNWNARDLVQPTIQNAGEAR